MKEIYSLIVMGVERYIPTSINLNLIVRAVEVMYEGYSRGKVFGLRVSGGSEGADGITEPVPRDQILRRERGQGDIHFPCPADHEQECQPYSFDSYSCYM